MLDSSSDCEFTHFEPAASSEQTAAGGHVREQSKNIDRAAARGGSASPSKGKAGGIASTSTAASKREQQQDGHLVDVAVNQKSEGEAGGNGSKRPRVDTSVISRHLAGRGSASSAVTLWSSRTRCSFSLLPTRKW